MKAGVFKPWDPEKKFDPQVHIDRGYIDVADNVVFQNHRDAMRCFGYTKGHFQRAVWKIPNSDKRIWFPKLYPNKEWNNELSEGFDKITMRSLTGRDLSGSKIDKYVVFAHYKNILGKLFISFLESFTSLEHSDKEKAVFLQKKKKIELENW